MINHEVNEFYGNNTNPPLHLVNLNQRKITDLQELGKWDEVADIYIAAARELEAVGVEGIAFCANTPHKVYEEVQLEIDVPVLHIADAVGEFIQSKGFASVGLLGTRFTMEDDFIRKRLLEGFGIQTIVPHQEDQHKMHQGLHWEMVMGNFPETLQYFFLEVIDHLAAEGAEAVILGCTEFPLLLQDCTSRIPYVDSVVCHVEAIVEFIMGGE
jgi:aspartate racemase